MIRNVWPTLFWLAAVVFAIPPAQALTVTSGPTATAVYFTSATLTWTTDTPSDGLLGVGPYDSGTGQVDSNYYILANAYDPTLTNTHTLTVTGLTPGTAYGAAGLAGKGQIPFPATPAVFNTLTPNPSAPYDFALDFTGTHHVAVGYDSTIEYYRTDLEGTASDPYSVTLTYPLPPGIHVTLSQYIASNGGSCGSLSAGSQTCSLAGAMSIYGLFRLSSDASATPGTYNIPILATSGGVSHTVNWTLQVDPAPQPLSRTPIATVPAIDSTTLSLWQQTMTGVIAKDLCNDAQILYTGYVPYTSGSNVWYYDGIRVYYQIADYTTDHSWDSCAQTVVALYRDTYVIPNNGKISSHEYQNFTQGLRMDYERTGNPLSLTAVKMLADNDAYLGGPAAILPFYMREAAYAGKAGMDANTLGDPAMAVPYFGSGSAPLWQTNINILLGQFDQAIDAGWGNTYIEPFMVGLSFETLIQYYQQTHDPRIPPAVKKMADWLWTHAWDPGTHAFVYDILSPPDIQGQNLNPLIVSAYGWLWAMTGDPKYLSEADQIFYAGVVLNLQNAEIGEGKQFSQSYRSSFDYVQWRTNPQSVFPVNLPTPQVSFGDLPINEMVTIANVSAFAGHTIDWTFTPATVANSAVQSHASSVTTIAASGSAVQPLNAGLSIGTYQVNVMVLDGSGNEVASTSGQITFVSANLLGLKVYPNPWRSDKHASHPTITFDGVTLGTTIKIFTVSGHEVKELHTDGPKFDWDLTNKSGDKVASGVYLYVITDGQGDKVRGKVAVIK